MIDTRLASAVATIAILVALAVPLFPSMSHYTVVSDISQLLRASGLSSFLPFALPAADFTCKPHAYKTEIISIDPLVIYLHDFLAPVEIPRLLDTAEPLFNDSLLTGNNGEVRPSRRRTSRSAKLPPSDAVVQCVLERAREFMGGMLVTPRDDFQPPQLARYTAGQHFDIHADWFDVPQERRADSIGIGASWNRPASFFAILEDNCTGGETWFPHVSIPKLADPSTESWAGGAVWREHENGGLAFKPVRGGAMFWINLFEDGTGDDRTRHAGLPVQSGVKTGMNIWPRVYYT